MKFNFFKWSNGEWTAQHSATDILGYGKTKFAAAKDLEAQVGRLSVRYSTQNRLSALRLRSSSLS